MPTPLPGDQAPELAVDLVGGGSFKLADASPENFTMIVFYRGLHCPVCKKYNRKLQDALPDFAELGVEVVAVSMDGEDRATKSVEDWELQELRVGYGLTEESARAWGLYLSDAVKDEEPQLFCEPGLFLVAPDGELFYASRTSMPWGRPDLQEMRKAIDFILEKDYPSRGRVA